MKNLKKVLALVLAFACAFTMFAGAAFSDQADIQSTEAVDALTALGVIEGYTDGSFRPDVTVTRAEMAKMIFTIINGGNDDASAYANLPTSFTDLTDNWYKGYIKYLQNSGIIAGTSATTFAPNETVTGVEAAKMLLVVAGYNADKAGLEGLSWMANTMKYANLNNLFEDVDTDINAGLPRQYAAQIMFNALDMERVVYSNDIGDFKPADAADVNDDSTIGYKYLSLFTYGDDADEKLYLTSVKKEDGRDTYSLNDGDYTRVSKDCSDLIGQRVAVMMKEGKSNQVYGVFAYEDSKVVATGFVGQMETVNGDDKKIKLDGTEYKLNGVETDSIVYNFNTDTKTTLAKLAGDVQKTRDELAAAEIVLIDNNGDGKVDTATYMPVSIGKVNAVTKTSVTVNGVGTLKFEDDTIYDGIAKNDYVRVIDENNTVEGGDHVQKLDVISGKVTGTRTGEAKVDNTWYKLAGGAYDVKVTTNTTYDLVIIGNTIFYADETDGSVKNVAYISAVSTTPDGIVGDTYKTTKVRMYFADGTNAEVKVSKVAGTKLSAVLAQTYANTLVTYTKLSDDTYDIKAVSGSNLAGCDSFVGTDKIQKTNGSAYYDSKIGGVSIADDAVIYVETKKETKVLTGAQVKDWEKDVAALNFDGAYLTKESNGIDYIQVAFLEDDTISESIPGAKDTSYAYAVTDDYTATVNGEDKIAVDAWNGSEVVTLYADGGTFTDSADQAVDLKSGDLFSYKVNGDFIEDVSNAYLTGAVLGFDGKAEGELRVTDNTTEKTYTLAEDCVVLTVDDAANEGVGNASLDSIVKAGTDDNDTSKYVPNIMYILGSSGDNAGKVVAIVIDSENNELA